MQLRFGGKSGEAVPDLEQSLREIQDALTEQQKRWAEQLSKDPAAFAQLEQQIHLVFGQLAERCAAGLLAHAASATACSEAAKKK